MINESGTMTGGGGKPRGGRMCLGSAAPRPLDTREAAAALATAEQELTAGTQVLAMRSLSRCANTPDCTLSGEARMYNLQAYAREEDCLRGASHVRPTLRTAQPRETRYRGIIIGCEACCPP